MWRNVYFFQDYPAVVEGLDLVEEDDQITHLLRLEDAGSAEDTLSEKFSFTCTCICTCTRDCYGIAR